MPEHFHIPSAKGDIQLHCMKWVPEGEIRMVLQLMHGMVECIEGYDDFARYMNSHGIAVIGHDHRGHGETGPVFGIIADSDGDIEMVRDALEVTRTIESMYPDKPVYLMGFSMGSFVARRCVTVRGTKYSGLIAVGSGNPPASGISALISGIRGMERIHGSDHTGPSIIEFTERLINRYNKTSENANSWSTTDSSLWEAHVGDPRYNFQFTYGAYRDLMTLLLRLVEKEGFNNIPKDLPVLFVSGSEDPVGKMGNGVAKAAENLREYGLDPDVIMYEGEMHCILDGKPGKKSRPDILKWLNRVNGDAGDDSEEHGPAYRTTEPEVFHIPSALRDIELHCMKWEPLDEPRLVLQIMHGMNECMDAYTDFASYMNANGIAVVGHDHRGHGGTGPVLGVTLEKKGDQEMVRDALEVTRAIESMYPDKPVYLMGFGMGSFVARRCVTVEPQHYGALLAIGTSNLKKAMLKTLIKGIRGLEKVQGYDHEGTDVIDYAGSIMGRFKNLKGNDSSWMSTDMSVFEAFADDPRYNFKMTHGGYRDIFTLLLRLAKEEGFDNIPKNLPVLFMSGGSDPIGKMGNGVEKAAETLREYGLNPDVVFYEGEMHYILNGKPGEKSRPDILDWVNSVYDSPAVTEETHTEEIEDDITLIPRYPTTEPEHFRIPSSKGDIELHCMKWIPEGEVRMVLQIMHGMVSCIEGYGDFASYMNAHGIAVIGHDHRGHGDTGPVLGVIAEKDGDIELVRDAFEVTRAIKEMYPDKPLYLMGFSMGSFVARRCVTSDKYRYDGLLALGTGNPPRQLMTSLITGIRGMEKVYGSDHSGPMIIESAGNLVSRFNNARGRRGTWQTTDTSTWESRADDPRYNFQFSYGAYRDLLTSILRLVDEEGFHNIPKDLPVLFMSGAEDPVGQRGEGVKRAAEVLRGYGLEPEVILYEGETHCFLDGKPGLKSRPDILDWLNRMNSR